jgi:hypothetical protein
LQKEEGRPYKSYESFVSLSARSGKLYNNYTGHFQAAVFAEKRRQFAFSLRPKFAKASKKHNAKKPS